VSSPCDSVEQSFSADDEKSVIADADNLNIGFYPSSALHSIVFTDDESMWAPY
jgi:hypothetical protein